MSKIIEKCIASKLYHHLESNNIFAVHTDVRPGFDSTSPAKSKFRFASHRTGNLAGKTKKSGTVGAFDNTGGLDTICILLKDVDPTAEKLYLPDHLPALLNTPMNDNRIKYGFNNNYIIT